MALLASTSQAGAFQVRRSSCSRRASHVARAAAPAEAYIALGLAHCFKKNDNGKLVEQLVVEPLSAPSLECLAAGARTSYKLVAGVSLDVALAKDPSSFPAEFAQGWMCENWMARCYAAARTWSRPHAQDNLMDLVPLGSVRGNFNFSLDDKRVLNMQHEVNDEDNVKQDLSIDVYGRKEKAEADTQAAAARGAPSMQCTAVAAAEAAAEAAADEEDELDALLAA